MAIFTHVWVSLYETHRFFPWVDGGQWDPRDLGRHRHGEHVHAISTNSECNIHEEMDTESSNPYQQLILNVVGLDFNA